MGHRGTSPIPQLNDADWLREQYITRDRNPKDIADELGISWATVYKWLEKQGIPLKHLRTKGAKPSKPRGSTVGDVRAGTQPRTKASAPHYCRCESHRRLPGPEGWCMRCGKTLDPKQFIDGLLAA